MKSNSEFYGQALTHVHDLAFRDFSENAAPFVIETLRAQGITEGKVVELGCGSGISSEVIHRSGYRVLGVDFSGAMIERARIRVPQAEFVIDSCYNAAVPPCCAVTAIGEVLSYAAGKPDHAEGDLALLARVHDALLPGGVFVFDIATPERAPDEEPLNQVFEGDGWRLETEVWTEEDGKVLLRRIRTIVHSAERELRSEEIHRLRLIDPERMIKDLRSAGFLVARLTGYGSFMFPRGLMGIVATKPHKDADKVRLAR